jgi:hypothetical protein
MQRKTVHFLSCTLIAWSATVVVAQPSNEVCNTVSGVSVCVRFDNRSYVPVLGTDFALVATDPPSVELLIGEDMGGSVHQWRVWSHVSQTPADIGSVTSPGAYHFDVKLRQPDGDPGAANIATLSLNPSGDHHSSQDTLGVDAGFVPALVDLAAWARP